MSLNSKCLKEILFLSLYALVVILVLIVKYSIRSSFSWNEQYIIRMYILEHEIIMLY